ncbi:hypothetical protein MKW98_014383, partial [Papaver atlanticum]
SINYETYWRDDTLRVQIVEAETEVFFRSSRLKFPVKQTIQVRQNPSWRMW